MKLYRCSNCNKIITSNAAIKTCDCCNQKLVELKPNTTEAAQEKHLPVVKVTDKTIKVTVGEVLHPMTEQHYISNIYLEFKDGTILCRRLTPNGNPVAVFKLNAGKPVAAYAYCNLHGVWKTKI